MNHHIIVLNLERSKERKVLLEAQFEKVGLTNYTFFPCFDGKDIINMRFTAPIIKGVGMGRDLQKTELAIIMSHIAALKHAQIMGYENVVILEDDVTICEDWNERLNNIEILWSGTIWDYIYLSGHSDYEKFEVHKNPILLPAPKMVGAFSYLVNKTGIEKLIKYCSEFATTYDDMIMHKIQSGKLIGKVYFPFMTYHSGTESLNWNIISPPHPSINYFKNKINEI